MGLVLVNALLAFRGRARVAAAAIVKRRGRRGKGGAAPPGPPVAGAEGGFGGWGGHVYKSGWRWVRVLFSSFARQSIERYPKVVT